MLSSKKKKILITGGAGFIGSNFVRHMYQKYPQYQLYNLDLLTYAGNRENLSDIEQAEQKQSSADRRYFFIQGDICNLQLIDQLFKKYQFDVVIGSIGFHPRSFLILAAFNA